MTLTSKGSSFTLGPEKDVKNDPCNTNAGGDDRDFEDQRMEGLSALPQVGDFVMKAEMDRLHAAADAHQVLARRRYRPAVPQQAYTPLVQKGVLAGQQGARAPDWSALMTSKLLWQPRA